MPVRRIEPSGLSQGRKWKAADVDAVLDDPAILGHLLGKTKLQTLYGENERETPIRDLHSHWIRHIWCSPRGEDTSLEAHRNSFKTTAISEIGVPFNWLIYPEDRVMLVRSMFTAAKSSMDTIARNMKHPDIVSLFDFVHFRGCTDTSYARDGEILYKFKSKNTKEGSITAFGVLQDFTGFHCDRVLGDDFISREDSFSLAKREKTITAVNEIQTNIITRPGDCHWIGTPWHKFDAWTCVPSPLMFPWRDRTAESGILLQGTGLLTPEEFDGLIWGERDGKRYRKITKSQEAANYDLDPTVADSGRLFGDFAAFGTWQHISRDVVAHIDARFEGSDLTALSIGSKRPDGKIQVASYIWDSHLESCVGEILTKMQTYHVKRFTMERNKDAGFGAKLVLQKAKDKGIILQIPTEERNGVKIHGYHESTNKHIKITSHLLHHWPNLVWDTASDERALDLISGYQEGEEPDDPPDSLASLLREFYDDTKTTSTKNWRL